MALPQMIIPSSTEWGSPSRTDRSMKAPGSPSSALQTTYLTSLFCLAAKDHFEPGGEARAAAAAQPGVGDLLDDRLGGHLEERLAQRLVAAGGLVVLDGLGIDRAAVAQHDALLELEEVGLGAALGAVRRRGCRPRGRRATLPPMMCSR